MTSSAQVDMIKPRKLPTDPIRMPAAEFGATVSPNVSLAYFFREQLDLIRMKEAFGRVVSNNPELAGRLRSKPFPQVSFQGAVGVPFHIVELSNEMQNRLGSLTPQEVAAKPMQTMDLWGEAGLVSSKCAELCKDTDNAFCTVCVAQGSELAIVILSISHAIVDGVAYYDVLRAWDAEFDSPGSTNPMTTRYELKLKQGMDVCCFCAGIWKMGRQLLNRQGGVPKKQKLDYCAIYAATNKQYNALKVAAEGVVAENKAQRKYSAETQKLAEDETVHVSGNDSYLAWVGSVLRSKLIGQMMNARGMEDQFAGGPVPNNYLGNALLSANADSAKGGGFDAMQFRKAVQLRKTDFKTVSCCSHGCFGYHEFLLHTSWAKAQHWPKFGSSKGCSLQFPHHAEWLVYFMNVTVHWQANGDNHMFMHSNLSPEQATSLKKACDDNDFSCSIISPAELMNYWKKDPTKIHE